MVLIIDRSHKNWLQFIRISFSTYPVRRYMCMAFWNVTGETMKRSMCSTEAAEIVNFVELIIGQGDF